jgi:hypothetical protein
LSKVKKTREDTPRRFGYIITNYRKARQSIDQSKLKLNDTSRELDEVINKYSMLNKFYGQVSTMPTGSFSQFQKANLESLLVSGADNATMALGRAREIEKTIPHFSAVVASGSALVLGIAEIARNIAESSEDTRKLVAGWNLPTPRENQNALSSKLHEIEPRLEVKLNGAWQTLSDRTKVDRFRQSSSSMRELISDTLQVLAPDSGIQETSWFSQNDPNRKPTQAERAYYAIVGKNPAVEQKDLKSAADLAKNIRESYEKLNKYTHERRSHPEMTPEDLESQLVSVFNETQIYLLEILRMREKFFRD